MPEFYDQSYNDSIPFTWWTSDDWRPTKWAYKNPGPPNWGNDNHFTTGGTSAGDLACVVNNVYLQVCYYKACGWAFLPILAQAGNFQRESNNNPSNWEYPYPTAWTWAAVNAHNRGFGLGQWTPSNTQYSVHAKNEWGTDDPWYPVFYNGWYQIYFNATEVFEYPYRQWVQHSAGPGHNPAPGSGGVYPGQAPDYNYRITFKDFAAGVIGDSGVPDNVGEKLDYLTGCYYWDYEQVGDYVADYTLAARRANASAYYTYLEPIFGNFTSTPDDVIRPDKPGPDFGLDDIGGKLPKWLIAVLSNRNRRYRIIT